MMATRLESAPEARTQTVDAAAWLALARQLEAAYAREVLGTQAPRGEQLRIVPSPQPETDRSYDLGR